MSRLIGRIKGVDHFLRLQGLRELHFSVNITPFRQCSSINKKHISLTVTFDSYILDVLFMWVSNNAGGTKRLL